MESQRGEDLVDLLDEVTPIVAHEQRRRVSRPTLPDDVGSAMTHRD